MKKYSFIINPVSGVSRKKNIPALIELIFKNAEVEYKILLTERAGHAIELAKNEAEKNADVVVAVGGDGTLNEIARGLGGTKSALGIIPLGSGNGLARHLKISMNPTKALQQLLNGKTISMDAGLLNEHLFLSNAGVGFTGEVIHSFHGNKMRGFYAYAWYVFRDFLLYKPGAMQIESEGKMLNGKFAFLNVFNASQFGYNVTLTPEASVQDGILEALCLPFRNRLQFGTALALTALSSGRMSRSFFQNIKSKEATVHFTGKLLAHIDGDPIIIDSKAYFKILSGYLNVVVPE